MYPNTHRVDVANHTVIYRNAQGEDIDLNAVGEPITNLKELSDFVCELHVQGAYDADVRDRLLSEVY